MGVGVGGREAPVLPLGREIVGRRSHAAAADVEFGKHPEVGAKAVGCEREVMIEPDAHTERLGVSMGACELGVGDPLDILIKQDAAPVLTGELGGLGRIGRT